jgi:elongation factor Ts
MADISAELVKELRERTGAGFMDCKRALTDADGDLDKAALILRDKGLAAAAKKADRDAREGLVSSYIHTGGRVGVLIEVNCETDFVAKTDDFQRFLKDVSMHIAGASPAPLYIAEADVDPAVIEKEREIRIEAAKNPKQVPGEKLKVIPEAMIPKVVEGQIAKWKKDVCLADQIWVRDPEGKKTIGSLLQELVAKLGENIKIRRFVRYELGEGLEKKSEDFAAEVAAQIAAAKA